MFNRAQVVDQQFVRQVLAWSDAEAQPVAAPGTLSDEAAFEMFESQLLCRQLDLIARELRTSERSYYTIGSSGHEMNVVLGRLTSPRDPAFLHYRSGAFMIERARHDPSCNIVRDALRGMTASRFDPGAGGRHKVWGSASLGVPPQTSTIASHLSKAFGAAMAIGRASRAFASASRFERDSIVVCSFGDASSNHSAAQGAINAAQFAAYQRLPVPLLLLCEDNGLGISVPTPNDWIETSFRGRAGLIYMQADGLSLPNAYETAAQAVAVCRTRRRPVFLHLKLVRLLGHAGSDFEHAYRSPQQVTSSERQDPLLRSARYLLQRGFTAQQLIAHYEARRWQVQQEAAAVIGEPRHVSGPLLSAPLAPYQPQKVRAEARRATPMAKRRALFGDEGLPEETAPKHLAAQLNRALHDLLTKYDNMVIFGEDVARKGGVYHVTANLHRQFGPARVFNTLLDETTILGLAQGFGLMGLLPVAEIQYLAYVHNAIDQLRGEACSLQYFSQAQFANPMVIRIASFGYQKGFGGHFHNDNAIATLREIPGLIIAAPARGDDAAKMLRTAVALAQQSGRVVAFLEPIALYMTRDLHCVGDGLWQTRYPAPDQAIPLGEGAVYQASKNGPDLVIISYANGLYLSLQAQRILQEQHGIDARVVDLRWLSPLNQAFLRDQTRDCSRVLIVDEGRQSGGISEAIVTALVEDRTAARTISRVVGSDSYIPLGPAAALVLPTLEAIVAKAQVVSKSQRRV